MLRIRGIKKRFRNFFLSVDCLDIAGGEHHILLGPTGSGKTLLLNIIAGLIAPDEGSLFMDERDISRRQPEERGFGIVYQDSALFPHLDVVGNIGFGLSVRGMAKKLVRRNVAAIMEELGIGALYGRTIHGLSGGERQRVALARALIMRPGLLLLDEPFSSLDYMTRMEMIEFIKKIRSEYNPSIFHITHDFEEALVMADRVSVIRAGAIVQQGRAHEVFHAPGDVFVAGFIGARNIFAGAAAGRGDAAVFKTEDGFEIYIGRDVSPSCRSAMVRADDIILARDAVETSATNTFRGRILDILPKRGVNEVCVDIGAQLYVYITNRSLRELGLGKGDSVYVLFKGSAVHVF